MEANIPYGSQWIKDLVPDVSWDAATSNIKMPDGSILPKSAYTIVDSKAYVQPDVVSKYLPKTTSPAPTPSTYGVPSGAPVGSAPTVQVASAPPPNSMWIRDLVPNAAWDQATQSITLPTGDVLPKNLYTLVGGKAYVNPYAIAEYYAPKPITPETMQPWIDKTQNIYQPMIDRSYDRINTLISTLQNKLDANVAGINASGDASRDNLQLQETADQQKLRNQAIARGTYTSGVADHQQAELAGDYAGQYSNLEQGVAAAIAAANADISGQQAELGYQAGAFEDSVMDKIMNLVSSLMGTENATNQQIYQNITGKADAVANQDNNALAAAVTRAELFGKVITAADAKILGVPVGTPLASLSMSSYGGSSGGGSTGGGTITSPGSVDLNNLSTDQKRAFDAALDLWEITGSSPASLVPFGIAEGTGFTPEWQAYLTEESNISQAMERITRFASGESSASISGAAQALGLSNYNLTVALNWVEQNKDQLVSAGANVAQVKNLLTRSMTSPGSGVGDGIRDPKPTISQPLPAPTGGTGPVKWR